MKLSILAGETAENHQIFSAPKKGARCFPLRAQRPRQRGGDFPGRLHGGTAELQLDKVDGSGRGTWAEDGMAIGGIETMVPFYGIYMHGIFNEIFYGIFNTGVLNGGFECG